MSEEAVYWTGWEDAAAFLGDGYPESLFTPLSTDELCAAVNAMNDAVPHASERMHAAWARHWSEALRRNAADARANSTDVGYEATPLG